MAKILNYNNKINSDNDYNNIIIINIFITYHH